MHILNTAHNKAVQSSEPAGSKQTQVLPAEKYRIEKITFQALSGLQTLTEVEERPLTTIP
jgi:hypothetical protein